jgi:hypothetical protein
MTRSLTAFARRRWRLALLLALGLFLRAWTTGIVSSNDGSHLALARALALRQETDIDEELALTLLVDYAERGPHRYSDRPPGTAFAALPAVWLGDILDSPVWERSQAAGHLLFRPASMPYARTFFQRRDDLKLNAPSLPALQGTAWVLGIYTSLLGILGAWAVGDLLGRWGVQPPGQVFAMVALCTATLWGPYATILFSHVTTGVALILGILAIEISKTESGRRSHWLTFLAGLALALAVSSDYATVVLVAGWLALCVPPRLWAWLCLGALPVALLTATYHQAAFGSPFAIGYDFHGTFDFAKSRTSTFGGDPARGAWTLWGLGRGAGALAQSPITLLGLGGMLCLGPRRWTLALLPLLLLLCWHRTPWGGDTMDHRYLVPVLPILALGLGLLWQRTTVLARPAERRIARCVLIATAFGSALLTWPHYLSWR